MKSNLDDAAFAIHWFRRDLRVTGNPALGKALKNYAGRVLGVFCFDAKFLQRNDFSHNRFGFFLKTLDALRKEFHAAGGELLVVDAQAKEFFPKLISHIRNQKKGHNLETIFHNRDYEPFARERDAEIAKILQKLGVTLQTERDHLILEPHELAKDKPGSFYQVYSPFARRWLEIFQQPDFILRAATPKKSDSKQFKIRWREILGNGFEFADAFSKFSLENAKRLSIALPEAGEIAALQRLSSFRKHLDSYEKARDIPAVDGTSQLSIYLKNGSLTSGQILSHLKLEQRTFKDTDSGTRFLKEIIWREFYYHILHHRPDVEHGAFLEKYKNLAWENRQDWFRAWCVGETGFPIVDAGMRQLNATGWMHNRVRMIVASFLTKDLMIDWRWGENYFMQKLLDGDLAPNNGGWQWAASTGCDPQPYFRVFNPWLQSEKFDPDGKYIKRFIPELKDVPAKNLHDPNGARLFAKYPKPIMEHAVQKAKAIALYKK